VKSTGDDFEIDAEWCHRPLGTVLDATPKKPRICAGSKTERNGEIMERRSQLGSSYQQVQIDGSVLVLVPHTTRPWQRVLPQEKPVPFVMGRFYHQIPGIST